MPLTAAEVTMHSRGIGASMIGSVLGVNPFSGPIDAWLLLTGRARQRPETDEEHARKAWGHVQEEVLAAWYARERGLCLEASPTLVHPVHSWVIATPDRIVAGQPVLLECKHVGERVGWHWMDGPPDYVRLQCVWQMMVCRALGIPAERVDVVAAIAGAPPVVFAVDYDADVEALTFEAAQDFWRANVLADVAPAVDGSSTYQEWLRRQFPRSNGQMLDCPEAEAIATAYAMAKAAITTATADAELAANQLRALIAENDGVKGAWGKATNRVSASGNRSLRVSVNGITRSRKLGRGTAEEIGL